MHLSDSWVSSKSRNRHSIIHSNVGGRRALVCYNCKNHRDFFQVNKNQLGEKQKRALIVSQEHGKASIVKGNWNAFASKLAVGIYCSKCSKAVEVDKEDATYLADAPFSLLRPKRDLDIERNPTPRANKPHVFLTMMVQVPAVTARIYPRLACALGWRRWWGRK